MLLECLWDADGGVRGVRSTPQPCVCLALAHRGIHSVPKSFVRGKGPRGPTTPYPTQYPRGLPGTLFVTSRPAAA